MNLLKSVREKFGGKSINLQEEELSGYNAPENFDVLMDKARTLYPESRSFSISLLQERFDISYRTAAKVMDTLEEEGVFEEEEEEDEFVNVWDGDL